MPSDVSQIVYALARTEPTGQARLLGTGFALSSSKVATALHVVGPDDTSLTMLAPQMSSISDYQDTSNTSVSMIPLTMCAVDPIRDLCILEVSARTSLPHGLFQIAAADAAPPGTHVVTFGFPHANSGRMVLTYQATQVGARVLIASHGQRNKHIVLNTQAREGQSGSPVFDQTLHSLVAVLIGSYAPGGGGAISLGGVDPATLHQTTHAISAEYLQGML